MAGSHRSKTYEKYESVIGQTKQFDQLNAQNEFFEAKESKERKKVDANYAENFKLSVDKFNEAKVFFDNLNFDKAALHLKESLKINPDNYLSDYYLGMCIFYLKDGDSGFDAITHVTDTLISSFKKLYSINVNERIKKAFSATAFSQIALIFKIRYEGALEEYEKENLRRAHLLMPFIKAAEKISSNELIASLYTKKEIEPRFFTLINIAVDAAMKAVKPNIVGESLAIIDETSFKEIKNAFDVISAYYFMQERKGKFISPDVNLKENYRYNLAALKAFADYNLETNKNQNNYISLYDFRFEDLILNSRLALKYTYYSVIGRAVTDYREESKVTQLINQAVEITAELILPRVHTDSALNRFNVSTMRIEKLRKVSFYICSLIEKSPLKDECCAARCFEKLYENIYNTIKYHFNAAVASYGKKYNKLKKAKNDEYNYYRNFLFLLAASCFPALKSVISFENHDAKYRLCVLKLLKNIAEEFLLLSDYKIGEIETSEKYSQILNVYGLIDGEINYLSSLYVKQIEP